MTSDDKIILISNSVPKSASTLLFNLQRSFMEGVFEGEMNYRPLRKFGITMTGPFIASDQERTFVKFLRSGAHLSSHIVVKMHTAIGKGLEEELLRRPNLFMSFAVRDPAEIYVSARRNFLRNGQFPQFSDMEKGMGVVNGHFQNIFRNVLRISKKTTIPFVKYEEIVADPIGALLKSLHPKVVMSVQRRVAEIYTNMENVEKRAAHRRSTKEEHDRTAPSEEEWDEIRQRTEEFRRSVLNQ